MKLKEHMSAIFTLAGVLITAVALLGGHVITQRHEDIRHLRRLAYQSAMEEWKVKVETIREAECYDQLPHFNDLLLKHIEYTYVIQKYGADGQSDKFAGIILDQMLEEAIARHKALSPETKPEEGTNSPDNTAK